MKDKNQGAALLAGVSLFSKLPQRYLRAIYQTCTHRSFVAGETLVEQGNAGVGLFMILEGRARVFKTLADGSTIDIATSGPGDVIGEMSVLDGSSRTASVVALEDVRCLVLSSWGFKAILETHPQVALGVLPVVVQRFRETSNKLVEMGARYPQAMDPSVATH